MKTPSNDLFRLIKSMSAHEKRQFKRRYPQDSQIYSLFKLIDAQEDYNEEQIRTQLGEESFVRNLKVHKNRLQQMVLENMRYSHTVQAIKQELRELQHNAEVLFEKNLPDLAFDQLYKGVRLAEQHEEYENLLPILGLLARKEGYFNELGEAHISAAQRMADCITIVDNYTRLAQTNQRLIAAVSRIFGHDFWMDLEVRQTVEGIIEEEILKPNLKPLSPIAERLYHHCIAVQHMVRGEFEQAHALTKTILSYFEQNPSIKESKHTEYFNCLINHLSACARCLYLEEAKHILEEVERLARENETLITALLYGYYFIAEAHYNRQDYRQFIEIWELKVLPIIQKFPPNRVFFGEVVMSLRVVEAYMAMRNHNTAGQILLAIMDKRNEVASNLSWCIYLVEIFFHLEQGDLLLVENLIAAHQKRLHRYKEEQPFVKKLFFYLKKILHRINSRESKPFLEKLERDLEPYQKDEVFRTLKNLFRFKKWLNAKIYNLDFADFLEQNKDS